MPDLNEQMRAELDELVRDLYNFQGGSQFATRLEKIARRQHGSAAQAVAYCVANPNGGNPPVLIYGNGAVLKAGDQLFAAPPVVATEQPAAAGNELTDREAISQIVAAEFPTWSEADKLTGRAIIGKCWSAIAQHLRAAPQAAQGEGLTVQRATDEIMYHVANIPDRVKVRAIVENTVRTIAAHTRASDGKDAKRLDFLVEEECYVKAITGRNSVTFSVVWPEFDERQAECYPTPNEAIDAAMQQAASNQQEGAK